MNLKRRAVLAFVLFAALVVQLAGCTGGGNVNQFTVEVYIQGQLDTYYKGQVSSDYQELMDVTPDEVRSNYEEGLEVEFLYMAQWFEIETDVISEEIYDRGVALMEKVYSHSSYTVKEPVKNNDGNYMIEVEVQPVDVFAQVYDGDALVDFVNGFWETYADVDLSAMSDAEYLAYENAWAEGILTLCEQAEANAGYLEAESVVLQVKQDDDGMYSLSQSDFDTIDGMILAYTAVS